MNSDPNGEASDSTQDPPWWRRGVVYQVYLRSFSDGNGDGTGDIAGLRARIPYLRDLGVDAIWINPWYQSPLADGGYDVADYRKIEPRYGTIEEAQALFAEVHEAGMKVIVDVVPNHTSVEHLWFKQALAVPDSPERARYHFRDGGGVNGDQPPTNWVSVFGGPAWTRTKDGQWYLNIFDSSQPDLNWENDEVRQEFESVLRFWLDLGADGFRVDVAHGLIKDMTFSDVAVETGEILGGATVVDHPFWDRDGIHEIVRTWRSLVDSYDDRMMVAEAWVATAERLALYLRPDEYHQSFNFDFLGTDWDPAEFARIIGEATSKAAAVGSTPTWVLSNHDVVRHRTRYGLPKGTDWRRWLLEGPHEILDAELGARRARAASMMMLALPGSAYLYMGDELGLPEVWDLPLEVLDDPVWERSGHTRKGRDGCRVPLPWSHDGQSFGFGSGSSWLPQPADWGELSVEAQQNDPASTLNLHSAAMKIRSEWLTGDESIELIETESNSVVAFERGSGVCCYVNMGTNAVNLPADSKILLRSGNEPAESGSLNANETVWVLPVNLEG